METQVKTNVMKTQVEKSVQDYLNNSEKHLFLKKQQHEKEYGDVFFKVIPVELNGKLCCIKISGKINKEKSECTASIMDTSWVTTKNHLGMMKNDIFYQFCKYKSIKRIGWLQEKFDKVKDFAEKNSTMSNDELKIEINKILSSEN